jgi:hypothetical protein
MISNLTGEVIFIFKFFAPNWATLCAGFWNQRSSFQVLNRHLSTHKKQMIYKYSLRTFDTFVKDQTQNHSINQIADGRGLNCRWVFLYLANTKLSIRNLSLVVFMEPTNLPYDNTQLYIAYLRDLQFASCIWAKLIRTHLTQIDLFLFSSPHNKCSIQDWDLETGFILSTLSSIFLHTISAHHDCSISVAQHSLAQKNSQNSKYASKYSNIFCFTWQNPKLHGSCVKMCNVLNFLMYNSTFFNL